MHLYPIWVPLHFRSVGIKRLTAINVGMALNAISAKICSGPEQNKKNGLILQICQDFLTEKNLKKSEQL